MMMKCGTAESTAGPLLLAKYEILNDTIIGAELSFRISIP